MKYTLLTTALALIATQTAMAAAMPDPFPCPTVRALKDVGVSSAMIIDGEPGKEWSGVEHDNNYYTPVKWTFFITVHGLKGKPKNEILATTNAAISTLILEGGPYPAGPGDSETYFCKYISTNGAADWAVAITPPQDLNKAVSMLKKR